MIPRAGRRLPAVRGAPRALAAQSEGALVFVSGDPDDAHPEADGSVRLDERVRRCRIDPLHDRTHWHSRLPLLDV